MPVELTSQIIEPLIIWIALELTHRNKGYHL